MSSLRFSPEVFTFPLQRDIISFFEEEEKSNAKLVYKLERGSDFQEALKVEGLTSVVLGVFDNVKNQFAGAMICSSKYVFINKKKSLVGYISSLKVKEEYKGGVVIARLMNLFKEYANDKENLLWIFSVFSDNHKAIQFFHKESKFLPLISPLCKTTTYIFKPFLIKNTQYINSTVSIKRANEKDIALIMEFLSNEGRKVNLFPYYSKNDVLNGDGLLQHFSINNLYLAFQQEKLIGVMGTWDQSKLRWWKLQDYNKIIKLIRPALNFFLKIFNMPLIPCKGTIVPYRYFVLTLIKDEDVNVFIALFNKIMADNMNKKVLFSMLLRENSVYNKLITCRSIKMKNTFFKCSWNKEENTKQLKTIEDPYIESGSL